jgi:hypothetical protein
VSLRYLLPGLIYEVPLSLGTWLIAQGGAEEDTSGDDYSRVRGQRVLLELAEEQVNRFGEEHVDSLAIARHNRV